MRRAPAPQSALPQRVFAALVLLSAAAGCGSGVPLWHGPHAAERGAVSVGVGASSTFLLGGARQAIRDAQQIESSGRAPEPGSQQAIPEAYARGALALAGAPPGIAPGVSARVGLGSEFEAGISYTGYAARLDVRRSFALGGERALSLGLGVFGLGLGQPNPRHLPSFSLQNLLGIGAELPLLVGVRARSRSWALWGGARVGAAHLWLGDLQSEPKARPLGGEITALRAQRLFAGPLLGTSYGTRHVRLLLELHAQIEWLTGRLGDAEVSTFGFALSPSTALIFSF